MTSVPRVSPQSVSEEIDLLGLFHSLWRRKLAVVVLMFCGAVMAALYAYSLTPVYEVSTVLRPAALNDLDALNRTEVYSLPPGQALIRVGAALDSYETRLSFFTANPQMATAFAQPGMSVDQAFNHFNNNALKLVQPDPKKADLLSAYIGIDMRYTKAIDGAKVLNEFVMYAVAKERSQIAADLKVIITNRVSEVESKLTAARDAYQNGKTGEIAILEEVDKVKRADLIDELKALRTELKAGRESRIAQLDEAIAIADSLGLDKPSTPSAMAAQHDNVANVVRTEINNQQIPLYFMGKQALQAERKVLRQRVSDDFSDPRVAQIHRELQLLENNRKVQSLKARTNEDVFLQGIESLRAEKARLLSINTDMSGLSLVSVDRQAFEPSSPVSPKKKLIVVVGAILGFVLAILALLVQYFLGVAASRRGMELRPMNSQIIQHDENAC